jgi:hypothetical protein
MAMQHEAGSILVRVPSMRIIAVRGRLDSDANKNNKTFYIQLLIFWHGPC